MSDKTRPCHRPRKVGSADGADGRHLALARADPAFLELKLPRGDVQFGTAGYLIATGARKRWMWRKDWRKG